ncbi:MAG TPA: serine/threonine-protein kinase [Opitutaceae bacterium]|nr:serine/threonine-protein kinase [Opitutaceae bacterium]
MSVMTCQSCGAPLDVSTAEPLCPACLLRTVLEAVPSGGGTGATSSARLTLPRTFGAYELTEELGRGGMGIVYRARQPALGRTVAVKLLLAGPYSSEAALRRFQLEAAAAAGLQHPNIVAIHDYGECEGQPYYAMDLVAGRNLAELGAGRPLPARRVAVILRLLAGAVHYAHQRGILHRDLKPSNVLIGEDERPRITDFGLAKVLGSSEGATATGQMLGSPSYVAPEQAAGRYAEIGVATDVYGLGALFYHLVTGRAPFNAATPTETLRLVLDTDPPPPRLLNPALPRDLETICLKCLAKEPGRRYATAEEVAADVERFLTERPIHARPPGAFYWLGKFTRRHRTAVAATAVVLLALVAGLGLALVGFRRAVVQRRETDAARGQAEQLVGLMTQDLKPVLEQRGGLPQLLKATEATVRYYESLPAALRSTKTERGHADALAALARLRGLSFNDRVGAEAALRAALTLREKIARENPDDPEATAAWLWDEWEQPFVTGDSPAQYSEVRQGDLVRRWQALQARFPDNLRVKQGLAEVLALYAQCAAANFNKPKEAVAAANQCRTLVEELVAARPQDQNLGDLIEKSLRALATALEQAGETPRAVAVSEQSLAYCTDALKADPGNLKLRAQTAEAARNLSYVVFIANHTRGLEAERIAREHYRVLIELSPNDQDYRYLYALTHMMECYYFFFFDRNIEATRRAYREFDALIEPFVGRKGYEKNLLQWTSHCLHLAVVAAQAGETAESRREIERAQRRFAEGYDQLPEGSFERCIARVRFLALEEWPLYWLRDWPEMARVARDCLAEIATGLDQQPANSELLLCRAVANSFLGIAAQREGRSAEAIALLQPAIGIIRAAPAVHSAYQLPWFMGFAQLAVTAPWALNVHVSVGPWFMGFAQLALAEALAQRGDLEQARQIAEQALFAINVFRVAPWPVREWHARVLTLAASLGDPAELPRCVALIDRAEAILTSPEAEGRLTVGGKEDLATIARLRAALPARLDLGELEKAGVHLDEAAAADPEVIEGLTRAGEAAWDYGVYVSADPSSGARQVELAAREVYRQLIARYPENPGFRFLFAATHRMECYVHYGWDGQVEPARAAFRRYDALLEPFVGRKGYDSVRRTRLFNSLHLAQLTASVGDRADADRWLGEAQKRFDAYRDRLPEGSPERALARVRFLEESAWSAWWLRDWPMLARLAQEAQVECDARLTEQPANQELVKRGAMAQGFAALAVAGTGRNAEAATLLRAAESRLLPLSISIFRVWDGITELWILEDALIEALRRTGDLAQARIWAQQCLTYFEGSGPNGPGEYWRGQKHLAVVRLLAANVLDPAVPAEAARRKELIDRAAATLAPDKVAGRLTIDVQEALREIERLRATRAAP